jgi:hypothetical protein
MQPGQTITVMAPDGSRTVKASIPEGLGAGDSFLVRLAKPIRRDTRNIKDASSLPAAQPKFGPALESWLSPAEASDIDLMTTPVHDNKSEREQDEQDIANPPSFMDALTGICHSSVEPPPMKLKELGDDNIADIPRQSPQEIPPVESTNLAQTSQVSIKSSVSVESASNTLTSQVSTPQLAEHNNKTRETNQHLILVQVPPGLSAGKTMHVEVPGENRTLSVQIPPNVETFHVSYTPRLNQQPMTPPAPLGQNHHITTRQQSPTGQKLLLVRVPPGTPAGTTLHVSVPDEPGRILAAQVPPGNVSEFHVSYEARPPGLRRGMLPTANPYAHSTYQQQTAGLSGSAINTKHKKDEQERRDEGETNHVETQD